MSKTAKQPARKIPPKAPTFRPAAQAALLALVTLLAYLPTLRAGWVWDDDAYVTNNPTLLDAWGLAKMWTDVRALPQWYPLVHTTFWLERRVWGLNPAGYHLDNVLLHAASAVLLLALLRRLTVPGALLAAALFALHPVQVESVAWVTERKNVLSGLFYFASFLAYLNFAPPLAASQRKENVKSRWRAYALALVFFLCALLSKTVTASLPAAILVVLWWKRGRLNLKRDVPPLIPFFLLGAALAGLTGHLERTLVGATGPEWQYAATPLGELAARTLIAGRAVWFYAAKLVWPWPLMFIYPRWHIDVGAGWQWLFPASLLIVLVALVLLRKNIGRGPAAGALLFVGTLVPALGFANVYPHRYSFVADHFQYLACVGVLVLIAGGVTALARRLKPSAFGASYAPFLVLIPLVVMTFARCFAYRDALTLWRDTLAKNPTSWVALTNVGNALTAAGRVDAALPYYARALEVSPDIADVQWNAGVADMRAATAMPASAARAARVDSAQKHFERAIELWPQFGAPYESLATVLIDERKDPAAATAVLERALAYFPTQPRVYVLLGQAAEAAGDLPAAEKRYEQAAAVGPDDFGAQFALGTVRLRLSRPADALAPLTEATNLDPSIPGAWANLGAAYESLGQRLEAAGAYANALRVEPSFAPARAGLSRLRGG